MLSSHISALMRTLPPSPWRNWSSIARIKPVPTISSWAEKLDTSILAALWLEAVESHAATRGSISSGAEEVKSMNLRNYCYPWDPLFLREPNAPQVFLVVPEMESFRRRRYGTAAEGGAITREGDFKRFELSGGRHGAYVVTQRLLKVDWIYRSGRPLEVDLLTHDFNHPLAMGEVEPKREFEALRSGST